MKNTVRIICLLLLLVFGNSRAQNIAEEFQMPSQNFIKFNQSIINPSLSVFSKKRAEIVLYHRNQWSDLSDAPKTYFINYTGNKEEKNGFGLSVYQKTVGIWKNIGAVVNYSRGVNLTENSVLALGFNVIGFNADLDRAKIMVGEADPLLEQYQKTSMVIINPGISLKWNQFNVGVYADNLFDYNFSSKKTQTSFSDKTYSGHLLFNSNKSENDNLFENSYFSLMARARYNKNEPLEYTGGAIYELPKAGWLQASYSSIYGVSGGIGFNVLQKIALGYCYGKSLKDPITSIGATHELFLSYTFDKPEKAERVAEKTDKEIQRLKTLEQEEIQRFKKKVYDKEIVETDKLVIEKTENFIKQAEEAKLNYLLLPEKNTGIKKGYYLISTVYTENYKAVAKVNEHKQKGLAKSGYFTTVSGEINYVFIERFEKYEDVKKAYNSRYTNRYKETLWVLPIL